MAGETQDANTNLIGDALFVTVTQQILMYKFSNLSEKSTETSKLLGISGKKAVVQMSSDLLRMSSFR